MVLDVSGQFGMVEDGSGRYWTFGTVHDGLGQFGTLWDAL